MRSLIGNCNPVEKNAWMHEGETDPREIIRRLMAAKGFQSESELAHRANVEQSAINRYMRGESAWLSTRNMQRLAECLGVTTSQLLGEVPLDSIDEKTLAVLKAMQGLPEHLKDVVVATSTSLAKNQPGKH